MDGHNSIIYPTLNLELSAPRFGHFIGFSICFLVLVYQFSTDLVEYGSESTFIDTLHDINGHFIFRIIPTLTPILFPFPFRHNNHLFAVYLDQVLNSQSPSPSLKPSPNEIHVYRRTE